MSERIIHKKTPVDSQDPRESYKFSVTGERRNRPLVLQIKNILICIYFYYLEPKVLALSIVYVVVDIIAPESLN